LPNRTALVSPPYSYFQSIAYGNGLLGPVDR
jgi:hypothetical protein